MDQLVVRFAVVQLEEKFRCLKTNFYIYLSTFITTVCYSNYLLLFLCLLLLAQCYNYISVVCSENNCSGDWTAGAKWVDLMFSC